MKEKDLVEGGGVGSQETSLPEGKATGSTSWELQKSTEKTW